MNKILLIVAVMAATCFGSDRFIRIVHQSDNHLSDNVNNIADSILGLAKDDANAWHANAFVNTGDASDTSGWVLKYVFDTLNLLDSQYFVAIGNHDLREASLGTVNDTFLQQYCTGTLAPQFKTGVLTSSDNSFRLRVFALDPWYWHSYRVNPCPTKNLCDRSGQNECGQYNGVICGGQLDSVSRILAADETSNGILLLFHMPPSDQWKNSMELADTIAVDGRPAIGICGHAHTYTINYNMYNHDSTAVYTVYKPPPSAETYCWTRFCFALVGGVIKPQFASVKNFTDPGDIYSLNSPFTIMSEADEAAATEDPPSTWSSEASTAGCTAGNWSAGIDILNSMILDNTSVVACTTACNFDIYDYNIAANYTGIWYDSGFSILSALGFSDDGATGKHTYPNSLTCNGAASIIHIGSGTGTISSQHTQLFLNGLTNMVLDCDKEVYLKRITAGTKSRITSSGAAARIRVYSDSLSLVVSDSAIFTLNQQTYFYNSSGGSILSQGPGSSLAGNNEYRFYVSATTAIGRFLYRIPAITHTGSWYFNIYKGGGTAAVSDTAIVDGDITTGNQLAISNQDAGGTLLFDFNDHNCTIGGALVVGSSAAGATNICKYGDSTHTIASFNGAALNGVSSTNIDSLEGSVFNITGSWTNGSNHVMPFAAGHTINFIGTAAAIYTTAGKSTNIITVNKTANGLTTNGVLNCNTLTLTDGTFTQTNATDTIYAVNATVNTTDAITNTAPWNISNKLTIAAGLTLTLPKLIIGGTIASPDTIQGGTLTADTISPAPYTYFLNLIFTKGLTALAGCSFNKISFGTYCNFTAPVTAFSDTLHFIGSPAGDTAKLWSEALNGGAVPRIRIGLNAGKIFRPQDTVQCLTFTLDSGKAVLDQTIGAHDVTLNSTTDSAQVSKPIWISGDLTLAAGAKIKWLAGSRIEFTEGATHNITDNGVKLPLIKYRGTVNRL